MSASPDSRIALFDMDGSLCDYVGPLTEKLKELASPGESPLIDLWSPGHRPSHIRNRLKLIKSQPGFWRSLPAIEGGLSVLRMAREIGFNIHVLTKGPLKHPNAWQEKVEWCRDCPDIGPDVGVHIVSDKGLVFGHVLYDDYPDYMMRWLASRPRGLGIMPLTPANVGFYHPNVVVWDGTNSNVVRGALEAAFRRAPGEAL